MTDQDLIALFEQRTEDAIAQTDRQYGAYCRSIIRSLGLPQEDMEECLNDAYLAVWRAIPPSRPLQFQSWLAAVVRNAALARLRAGRRRPETASLEELQDCLPGGLDPVSETEARQLSGRISEFLLAQPAAYRIAFVRRYWYQDSIDEISRRQGWSENRTKGVLFRMRNKLRKILQEEGLWHE